MNSGKEEFSCLKREGPAGEEKCFHSRDWELNDIARECYCDGSGIGGSGENDHQGFRNSNTHPCSRFLLISGAFEAMEVLWDLDPHLHQAHLSKFFSLNPGAIAACSPSEVH